MTARSGDTQDALPEIFSRRVVYASSARLTALADRLPSNPGRSRQVHELVEVLGLLDRSGEDLARARVVAPAIIGKKDLARFHSEDFVGRLVLPRGAVLCGRP